MNILLSLKPEYAELIYSGKKSIEWRHTFPDKVFFCDRVYIYETAPVKKVTGYFHFNLLLKPFYIEHRDFELDVFTRAHKSELEEWGQLPFPMLQKYAESGPVWGWHILNPVKYQNPFGLAIFGIKRPPQSWQYIETNKTKKEG